MGEVVVAFVSQYPRSPRGRVILYGVLLYTCESVTFCSVGVLLLLGLV